MVFPGDRAQIEVGLGRRAHRDGGVSMAQGLVVEVEAPRVPVDLPEWARDPLRLRC